MTKSRNLRGKALIEYKKCLKLNNLQREVLVGTLLGDATIIAQSGKSGRCCSPRSGGEYNIKFEQQVEKSEYIQHLYEIFEPFVGTPPKIRNITGGGAKDRQSIWFRTYRHTCFRFYYDIFYPQNMENNQRTKRVPKHIRKLLTAKSLAYWFMDDGSFNKKNKYLTLSTHCFPLEDQQILVQTLKKNLNLQFKIYRDRNRYFLMTQDIQQLKQLIQLNLQQCFYYKTNF